MVRRIQVYIVSKRIQAIGLLIMVIGIAIDCGGSGTPAAPSSGILVAGTYAISRSWVVKGCDPETPGATAPVTGTVAQTQGSFDFALRNSDGGNFNGRLTQDGSFTNGKVSLVDAAGVRYDILFEGKFTTNGFTATLTGDQHRATGDCREVIAWQATKTAGGPNVTG
jgi:hypothetical protein